jgi:hypothetical protein
MCDPSRPCVGPRLQLSDATYLVRPLCQECLLKKIDASAQIGDGGIALIHQLVNKMGFTWHERKTDAGIDGEIELRNPVTGEVANTEIQKEIIGRCLGLKVRPGASRILYSRILTRC